MTYLETMKLENMLLLCCKTDKTLGISMHFQLPYDITFYLWHTIGQKTESVYTNTWVDT